MGVRHSLNTDEQVKHFMALISHMRLAGKDVTVEFVKAGTRTPTQNAALHLWMRQVAECLNDAGYDVRTVIKEDVEIPWTEDAVKEYLWRPVQKALTGNESTASCKKLEYSDIYDTIVRHLASRFGIPLPPWPQL